MRSLFPLVSDAVSKIVPLDELRWITFGHVEADECGAMNQFLAVAPERDRRARCARVHGPGQRPRRPRRRTRSAADEVLDLGGKRVRNIDTPHVPHGWDAHVLYEETTGTLFCGDLFTRYGERHATTTDDIVEAALEAEQFGGPTALTPVDRADDPAARASSTSTRWR